MTLESNDEDIVQSVTNIKAGMAELKVNNLDVKAENECIFNMFGEATKLTENVLSTGKIVHSVCIYGILVNAHQHQESLLLKTILNRTAPSKDPDNQTICYGAKSSSFNYRTISMSILLIMYSVLYLHN